MKHTLLRTSTFVRDSKRLVARRRPEIAERLLNTLRLLEADPYIPSLKTHRLKGKPAILLETVGTHDEVY